METGTGPNLGNQGRNQYRSLRPKRSNRFYLLQSKETESYGITGY